MEKCYDLLMEGDLEQYPELQRFIMGRSNNCNLVTMVRPGNPCRKSRFTATVYLSDMDADYAILRFGLTLKQKI